MPGLTPPGIHVHPCITLEAGTPDAMASTVLTPNRLLKSQIGEWQGRSSAQWVGDLISAVARDAQPFLI